MQSTCTHLHVGHALCICVLCMLQCVLVACFHSAQYIRNVGVAIHCPLFIMMCVSCTYLYTVCSVEYV